MSSIIKRIEAELERNVLDNNKTSKAPEDYTLNVVASLISFGVVCAAFIGPYIMTSSKKGDNIFLIGLIINLIGLILLSLGLFGSKWLERIIDKRYEKKVLKKYK